MVRAVIIETKQLHIHLTDLISLLESESYQPDTLSGLQSQLLFLHLLIQSNKRALLLYHNTRIDLLTSHLALHSYSLSILFTLHPNLHSFLSPNERSFLKRFSSLMVHSKSSYLDFSPSLKIDIADHQAFDPIPTNLLVTVKVNKHLDNIWLSTTQLAPTTLTIGQTVTINKADVRNLIARGWLTVIDHPA